jgi:hypothetical protein
VKILESTLAPHSETVPICDTQPQIFEWKSNLNKKLCKKLLLTSRNYKFASKRFGVGRNFPRVTAAKNVREIYLTIFGEKTRNVKKIEKTMKIA